MERSIYIDTDIESKVMSDLNSLGMDFNQAVNKYLRGLITQDNSKICSPNKKRPMKDFTGILKGKIWVSDDFDDPLEDMKEYME